MAEKIDNLAWFPILADYAHLANVERIVIVNEEDVDAAGAYEPDDDMIVVNMAVNLLASVADRYGLPASSFEETAMCVFIEECAHSRGIEDEAVAATMARTLMEKIPKERLEKKGGIATYMKNQLVKMTANY